jgi:tetratricopeptide (TPR) repeat protein
LLTKYSDTVYKAPALDLEAGAYHKKGDDDHAQVYAEQAIQADPKDYQAPLLVAETIVQHTRENDLDKEEKLAKAEKDLNLAMENTKAAPKPNPQTPDAQWDEFKKSEIAEEQANMGRVFLLRKKFDEAVANLQPALEADPQPAYFVWLATAQVGADKNDEALATCSKLLEQPNLLPIFKQVISGIRAQALMAKAKAAPGKQ